MMNKYSSVATYICLPAMAMSTAVKNCLLSFISDWIVGKLVAPAYANIVVLKAGHIWSMYFYSIWHVGV